MCNLYSQKRSLQEVRDWFGVEKVDPSAGNLPEQKSIFPGYLAPVIYSLKSERTLCMMTWGFVLTQSERAPKHINNCRDDKINNSKFWKSSFVNRRCLVPASKFSEYHPSLKNRKGHKASVWFALKDKTTFAFAGIWTTFQGEYRGKYRAFDTYSIITTTPNSIVKPIHSSRMPVILEPANYQSWLEGSIETANEFIREYPSDLMRIANIGLNFDD